MEEWEFSSGETVVRAGRMNRPPSLLEIHVFLLDRHTYCTGRRSSRN